MNYPMAIVFSTALLVGSCVANQQPAISQSESAPKFQVVASGPQTAWRLDTQKGSLWYCASDGKTARCIRSE